MAYINRLSDINNKLDITIENQTETNDKLANIDDNTSTLNNNIKNSFNSTNNSLNISVVDGKEAYLYNGSGTTSITSTTLSSNHDGIDTASSMYVSDGTTRTALTSTAVVNYGQTVSTAKSGLNIYQIYPKKIHYSLIGRSESSAAAVIMGGSGSQKFYYDFTFGLANPQTFSAIQSGGSVPRTIKYDYVDVNGNLQTNGSATFTVLNTVVTLNPTNIISINNFFIDGVVGTSEQVLIRVGTANTAANTIASSDVDDYYNGVITVPNGYIGYLTNFSLVTPGVAYISVLKWNVNSIRSVVYTHYNGANAPVSSGFNGSIGGIFTAGESIAFGKSAVGASLISGNFVLEPI